MQTKFDAQTLHDKPAMAASSRMVDDGKGAKEVFRVDNFDLLQVKGIPVLLTEVTYVQVYLTFVASG